MFHSLPDRYVCGGGCPQAIVGELVTDQGIQCCALTSPTYLTWLMCWTSVEVAHHRAVRSPQQPLAVTDMYLCAPTGMVCWRVLQGTDQGWSLESRSPDDLETQIVNVSVSSRSRHLKQTSHLGLVSGYIFKRLGLVLVSSRSR